MDELQKIRAALAVMAKHISLRQVAIQSGINYITLRNIKSGKSGRVTDSVAERFVKFQEKFSASPAAAGAGRVSTAKAAPAKAAPAEAPAPAPKKRGPKPKAAAPVAAAAPKKRGPKPKAAPVEVAPAPKKPGPKPKAAAAKKKVVRAAKAKPAAPKAAPAALPEVSLSLLGGTLTKEIAMAEARLDFLKELQKLEADFLRKIGK